MNVERGMTSSFMSQEAESVSHTRIQASPEGGIRFFVGPALLVAIVQLLSQGGYAALAFAVGSSPLNCTATDDGADDKMLGSVRHSDVLAYVQSALWVLFFLMDLAYASLNRRLKLGGYLRHYRTLRRLQCGTFFVFTFFTAVTLAYGTYSRQPSDAFRLSRLCGERIIVGAESVAIAALAVAHIIKIFGVGRLSATPDALEDTTAISFRQHSLDSSEAIGFKAEDYVDDILERQADTIRCLREQNAALSKKLCHREWTALA